MSATYTKITGKNYIDPSFIIEGWAVEVAEPYIVQVDNDTMEYHPERSRHGFVFDRDADDHCGYVGDYRWHNASNQYLWKTKEQAMMGYQKYFENHRKFWEKFGIKTEDVFKRVCHIIHKSEIKIID